jgi:hypothetical protein
MVASGWRMPSTRCMPRGDCREGAADQAEYRYCGVADHGATGNKRVPFAFEVVLRASSGVELAISGTQIVVDYSCRDDCNLTALEINRSSWTSSKLIRACSRKRKAPGSSMLLLMHAPPTSKQHSHRDRLTSRHPDRYRSLY